jgi:energy-dependent translational throttle protein EttA
MSEGPNKVICSMIQVSKFHNRKPVLQDISLSYFYGAKIGVLGLNGAGKSSLLRILAGVDTEFNGQRLLSSGYTVGFLAQEPRLDEDRFAKLLRREFRKPWISCANSIGSTRRSPSR